MAIDPTFIPSTETRILGIEEALGDLWILINSLMSQEQYTRLYILIQGQKTRIDTTITELEERVDQIDARLNGQS